jgi:hypothetical protein
MGFQIESGAGNGASVVVTDDGRINTSSRQTSRFYFQSRVGNRAYSWTNATYDYAAGDTILLVKNTNTTLTLVIHSIVFSGDTTSLWHVHRPTSEVTVAGTTVTGVNLNGLNSSIPALAEAAGDETGNTQGDIIYSAYVLANTPHTMDENSVGDAIRLGTNQSIGVDAVTDGTGAVVTIAGYYETDSKVAA